MLLQRLVLAGDGSVPFQAEVIRIVREWGVTGRIHVWDGRRVRERILALRSVSRATMLQLDCRAGAAPVHATTLVRVCEPDVP